MTDEESQKGVCGEVCIIHIISGFLIPNDDHRFPLALIGTLCLDAMKI